MTKLIIYNYVFIIFVIKYCCTLLRGNITKNSNITQLFVPPNIHIISLVVQLKRNNTISQVVRDGICNIIIPPVNSCDGTKLFLNTPLKYTNTHCAYTIRW